MGFESGFKAATTRSEEIAAILPVSELERIHQEMTAKTEFIAKHAPEKGVDEQELDETEDGPRIDHEGIRETLEKLNIEPLT